MTNVMKTMNSKFPGKCGCGCGTKFNAGTQILWSRATGAMLPGHAASDNRSPKSTRRDAAPKMPRWNSAARRNVDDVETALAAPFNTANFAPLEQLLRAQKPASPPPAMDDAEFASLAATLPFESEAA